MPALYLALTLEGMLMEMGHGFGRRFEPLTICSYSVDVDDIIDLRTDNARAAMAIDLAAMASPWALERSAGRTPASWGLCTTLLARGAAGILVPSFANGATPATHNLVLWRWGTTAPHRVEVHDPTGRLPRNPSSWSV
jgi:RES domain-containing protein